MANPKIDVLKAFLAMVAGHVPFQQAILATLGGKGLEAKLWKERGVPANNGWLIERTHALSNSLIRSLPYRCCGNLGVFPRIFSSVHGRDAGIDGFHLDLCGTIEPRFSELKRILPLVTRSKARCLAITVADQRRNLSVEQFHHVAAGLSKLLGKPLREELMRWIQAEQEQLVQSMEANFDPEKGAKRELGVFSNVALSLAKRRGPKVPVVDTVERYIYVSNYSGTFRMRSYFLRFGQEISDRKTAHRKLADLWQKSKLFVYEDRAFHLIHPILTESRKEHAMSTLNFSRLQALAQAAGGEALEQFNTLKEVVERSSGALVALDQIRELAKLDAGKSLHANRAESDVVAPVSGPKPQKKGKLAVTLDLLRAAAKGDEAFEKAYEQAFEDLGLKSRKYASGRRRIVGGDVCRYARWIASPLCEGLREGVRRDDLEGVGFHLHGAWNANQRSPASFGSAKVTSPICRNSALVTMCYQGGFYIVSNSFPRLLTNF